MKTTWLFKGFFESEKAGGIILIFCTIISLILANSGVGNDYLGFWNYEFNGHSITHWINDGLMAIFFLMIGLELEREIYIGELSSIKNALLPMAAAVGGILVPAGIYFAFNYGTDTQSGIGIPMATDIAFALGILSLLGNKVPVSLKIFLTALAITDDIGAIIVIAIFYTKTIIWMNLVIALSIFLALCVLNRMRVHNLIPYFIGGIAMWYFMLNSGVHATITGVLLAFAIPFGNGDKKSPSYNLQHFLHRPVAFIILPLFALSNTAIIIGSGWMDAMASDYSKGIAAGLVLGKPLGITLFSFLVVAVGLAKLPEGLNWKVILGAGFLGGIGFTMSIFISLLAFADVEIINNSKIMILLSSLVAGTIGILYLKSQLKTPIPEESNNETDNDAYVS